uniref:NADH dehydrogenase [ubiquinone] flavoprotein 3, mitochondrial n=1 Tax=Nothoprocta perdicaria TaxID=30464 RepID=A0A8C7EDW4_NOTPE
MSRKTVVAFPQRAVLSSSEEEKLTETKGGLRKELAEEETSSSSSDSDSSSDSEEEKDGHNKPELAIRTRAEFPRQDSTFSKNSIAVCCGILSVTSRSLCACFSEAPAAAQPAPEEFDSSTYKNLQHHDYDIYTFADSNVLLSKFRQPQPSSGRPSPRH